MTMLLAVHPRLHPNSTRPGALVPLGWVTASHSHWSDEEHAETVVVDDSAATPRILTNHDRACY